MRLLPYTYSSLKRGDKLLHILRILMEGKQIWTESSVLTNPIQEALEPNGLYVQQTFEHQSDHYFCLDTTKTDIKSMYDYKECEPNTDMLCWNIFYIITDLNGIPWIDIPKEHTYLKPILKAHYV